MSSIMRKVEVSLGARSYEIQIGEGLLTRLGVECQKLNLGRRCAVITDRNVGPIHGLKVMSSLEMAGFEPLLLTLAPGEKTKSLETVQRCYDQLANHRLERKGFVVALGGGVVGDISGFVAATYLRGIPFVQVPTTLLAQVDSSVGGKTGVNLEAGKNLVGAFHQPRLVLCDLKTLRTLPRREFAAGLAEVIKYGVIYDAVFFERLERDLPKALKLNGEVLAEMVSWCCEIKAEVVRQDETESGLRAILNFGHTIGHAIEALSGYGAYLHGEALSIGQVAAAVLSSRLLGFPLNDVQRMAALLARAGLPISIKVGQQKMERLFAAMQLDKKVSGGEINFVLAEKLGKVIWGQKVSPRLIEETLQSMAKPRVKVVR